MNKLALKKCAPQSVTAQVGFLCSFIKQKNHRPALRFLHSREIKLMLGTAKRKNAEQGFYSIKSRTAQFFLETPSEEVVARAESPQCESPGCSEQAGAQARVDRWQKIRRPVRPSHSFEHSERVLEIRHQGVSGPALAMVCADALRHVPAFV